MSLEARDLCVMLGGAQVVADVSLVLQPGEVVAVIGPNGAGKSTLLRALAGSQPPLSGSVSLDGVPLRAWPRRALAQRRAVLAQSVTVGFPFTVREIVRLGRSALAGRSSAGTDAAAVAAAMRAADVAQFSERRCTALSGGEQQRVHLARALAQIWPGEGADGGMASGRYLLLDEPTASLDIAHQHLVLGAARALARRGIGVLAVLHDPNLAALHADRIVVMEAGQLVAVGRPEEALRAETISAVFRHPVSTIARPDGRVAVLAAMTAPNLP